MPELAEVEITRLKLLPLVKGRRILDFWTDWPRALRRAASKQHVASSMRGRRITDVWRHGKVLFLDLSGKPKKAVAIHLRMSGRLLVTDGRVSRHPEPSGARRRISTSSSFDRWTHFVWRLSGDKELRFIDPRKFGVVWYGNKNDFKRDKYLARLGHDARAMPYSVFRKALSRRAGMIKAVLLRQDVFAGIGNIIADETLWRAKIHPQARVADLPEAKLTDLHSALVRTVDDMLSAGGTSLRDWSHPDGKIGGYQQKRKIYGKAGEPCPRCRIKLHRLIVAGRGTTVCLKCQRFSTKGQSSKLK